VEFTYLQFSTKGHIIVTIPRIKCDDGVYYYDVEDMDDDTAFPFNS